jgi:hypothetical protein
MTDTETKPEGNAKGGKILPSQGPDERGEKSACEYLEWRVRSALNAGSSTEQQSAQARPKLSLMVIGHGN